MSMFLLLGHIKQSIWGLVIVKWASPMVHDAFLVSNVLSKWQTVMEQFEEDFFWLKI